MASSTEQVITKAVQQIMKVKPRTILDIGVGFGKWGFLCREYLECWNERVYPSTWEITIDGIEIWEPFTKLLWVEQMYDCIYIGDAAELIDTLGDYDLIIASDVIEHLEKPAGLRLLESIIRKSKSAIVNIPVGEGWMNNKLVDNNPYNAHKAVWQMDEIIAAGQINGKAATCHVWPGVRGKGVLAFYEVQRDYIKA